MNPLLEYQAPTLTLEGLTKTLNELTVEGTWFVVSHANLGGGLVSVILARYRGDGNPFQFTSPVMKDGGGLV